MKNFALIFLFAIALTNCKNVESQQVSNANSAAETNSTKVETAPPAENLLGGLTKKQKQKLDETLPPKVREILDKADEIDIYYDIDKETKGLRTLTPYNSPNAGARLSNASLKKQFLDSFYYDAALGEGGAMCFSPRHKITAKYNDKTVDLDICYQCGNFKGESSIGHIGGSLQYETKSVAILTKVIEKFGADLK